MNRKHEELFTNKKGSEIYYITSHVRAPKVITKKQLLMLCTKCTNSAYKYTHTFARREITLVL